MLVSEASVSTQKGMDSSMDQTVALIMSCLISDIAFTASSESGNLGFIRGLIFVE